MGAMELQISAKPNGAGKPALSDAFLTEFGNQPVERASLQGSHSDAARLVDGHFDELANLAARRNGTPSWLQFSATPRTVSYNDLKEMEKLADDRLGLRHHYPKEYIDSMESSHVGWSKVYGTAGGALAGGIVRLAVPVLHGRGALVTAGILGLGAIAGYNAGEWIGQKTFDSFAERSNYLSLEKAKYGAALGGAWSRNAKIAAGAEAVAGLATVAFGGYRVAVGLGIGALVTYISAPMAHYLGRSSAIAELNRESALGHKIANEWLASE